MKAVNMVQRGDPFKGLEVEFCSNVDGGPTVEGMAKMVAGRVFNGDSPELERFLVRRYQQMHNNFANVRYDDKDNDGQYIWNLDGCQTIVDPGKPDARLQVPRDRFGNVDAAVASMFAKDNFGHDLPAWLHKRGLQLDQAKRVMFVFQDPKRSGDQPGSVYLSTPFALHCNGYRSSGRVLPFTSTMADLVSRDVLVYATDYLKWYAHKPNWVEDNCEWAMGRAEEILEAEIEVVRPHLIVTFGKPATKCLNPQDRTLNRFEAWLGGEGYRAGTYNGYNTLAFLHLSGANGASIKKVVGGGGGNVFAAYRDNVVLPQILTQLGLNR